MKWKSALAAMGLSVGLAGAQGTFVYDQESTNFFDGEGILNQPSTGQSFSPALDSIDFVQFLLRNSAVTSIMTVNLRGDSINGPILGTTIPTSLDPFFSDYRNFSFPNRIKMSPGTKYFLEPVVISGTGVFAGVTYLQYPGGDAIYNGAVFSDRDFMFREGIIVPEPSFSVLFAIGMSALMWKLLIATRLKR